MNARMKFDDQAPHYLLLKALEREQRAAERLNKARADLDVELRWLSRKRGLTVKLTAEQVRSELKMREQAGG